MDRAAVSVRQGSHPRGEDTRRRILDTAIALFASEGFDGASTRQLAERAGVNLPAIQYYFGSKEGLYRAAIEHIGNELGASMAPAGERVQEVLSNEKADRRSLILALTTLTDALITVTLGEGHQESRKLFIARAEVEDLAALDSLHEAMVCHVARPCMALVARLLERSETDELVIIKSVALLGQVFVFCRAKAQRALGWSAIDASRVELIRAIVRQHIGAIFASGELS